MLKVPFLPQLDSVSLDTVSNILDEQGTRQMIEQLNWPDEFPYKPLTSFTIGHSETAIYIDFFTRCNFLRAVNYQNNSPVSQDSCVEVFLSPKGSKEYWNFEFNCIGAVNASHREERPNPTRLTDSEIEMIERFPSCGTRPFEEIEGLFVWSLTVKIPLKLMGLEWTGQPIELLGNFYKCASKCTQPHYLSWQPIHTPSPDFHRPESFGQIILEP